jgi:hypothetical protein
MKLRVQWFQLKVHLYRNYMYKLWRNLLLITTSNSQYTRTTSISPTFKFFVLFFRSRGPELLTSWETDWKLKQVRLWV